MIRSRTFAAAVAGLTALAGVVVAADSAEAQSRARHRSASVSGPYHSASRSADIHRSPGSASVSRSGSIDGHGWFSSRARATVDTGNGYATSSVRVGPAGNSQSRTASIAHDTDSYSRSAGIQTSNGYGYDRQVDAYRDESGVTVNRTATANNGAGRSSTVTYPY
ncbi:hypothetical protein [Brevundimonas sp.]|jgi:hypothetical protein|uniref:hypothetical protein n=1 Tax=Brevundimonas sp. TaxID=1871086 RepID=UPI0037C1237C